MAPKTNTHTCTLCGATWVDDESGTPYAHVPIHGPGVCVGWADPKAIELIFERNKRLALRVEVLEREMKYVSNRIAGRV